jgi:hypothetical protein
MRRARTTAAIAAASLLAPFAAEGRPKFYAISHMVNTLQAVKWAVPQGVNGLEVDVQFAPNGEPRYFKHGHACDCVCTNALPGNNVCKQLGSFGDKCDATTPIPEMLHLMAAQRQIALVIFDSKIAPTQPEYQLGAAAQKHAANRILQLAEEHLFGKGYRGKLLVSGANRYAAEYVREVARVSQTTKYASRIYIGFDMENGGGPKAADTMRLLASFPTKNRAYGCGITVCAPFSHYYAEIAAGAKNVASGSMAFAYHWSLNDEGAMEKYIDAGADGIMTNYPGLLVAVAKRKGLVLAKPEDPFPAVTNDRIVGGGCDCDHAGGASGGCVISARAPDFQACKCESHVFGRCTGNAVPCNPSAPLCRSPNASIGACVLGGGNCDGYAKADCDCNHHGGWSGGCSISKAAPQGTACRCESHFGGRCSGSVVKCRAESSPLCRRPDMSKASCLLGGGNCSGY